MIRTFVFAGAAFLAFSAGAQALTCEPFKGYMVSKFEIGLPSGDATIVSADTSSMPATMAGPEPTVAYCKLIGSIAPLDSNAPPIRFQINLPAQWNGRSVQYGGGGFNGTLISGLAQLRDAPADLPPPVALGFMTVGTDSGHDNSKLKEIQEFALNNEALENFAHASYKKVRDVAIVMARSIYGRAPDKLYFFGGSEGGREGLTMAQRYPNDFDGIVSVVPVINWVGLQFSGTRSGLLQMDGGWLSPAKVKLLHETVLATCDAADGLKDGIVSRWESCPRAMNPKSLRCPDGKDTGDTCLSDAQIRFVEAVHGRFEFPYPLANGIASYPGWNYGGEDQVEGMVYWMTGTKPPQYPLPAVSEQGRDWYYGAGAMRYFIARDPNAHPRDITPEAYKDQVLKVSALMDSTNPDLSGFQRRGGKLILKENMADPGQSPNAGVEYYNSVVGKMGQNEVDRFIRFYVTPGANHGGSGSGANGAPLPRGVDLLAALDRWVLNNEAPGVLIQTAQDAKPPFPTISARPMCRYPAFPKFKGGGDPSQASSFECAVE
ncbi:MAG: tannase/feruloyl esterase family alpha/beta hydrolase [Pseudorhodoplanes sp.]